MLIWVSNAPTFGISPNECITQFIDQYVTCSNEASSPDLVQLLNYQNHRHAQTCKKGNICRFGSPLFPMSKTMILKHYLRHFHHKKFWTGKKYERIGIILEQMKFGESITFNEFLNKIEIS